MKAIVIHHYGPPEVLKYESVPDPEPRAGEIRIRIHAATVNRVLDVSLRAGNERARGPVLPCAAIELPDQLDFHHAAVVMRHVPTAWNLLVNVAGLKAGETVLIMGAGGNLGSIGIQIAKNVIGAKVIAAAGSDERVKTGLELGADHAVNYNACDLQAEVMALTDGKGVDVLYDNIANPKVLPKAFRAIGFDGRLVTAGAHAGPHVAIDFAHLYHKRITIKGQPGYHPADVPKCFAAAAAGRIKAQIERVLPLSRAAEAHRLVESGESLGKIVLDPTRG